MTLKQSNYKSITALLLILVIAVGAVWAPLYVEASHGHDCSGTACPVCLTVSVIGSCLNYVLPALLPTPSSLPRQWRMPALLPLLLSLSVPAESVGSRALPASLARLTLIGLKVRLDN